MLQKSVIVASSCLFRYCPPSVENILIKCTGATPRGRAGKLTREVSIITGGSACSKSHK